jgi:predicted outer membrane protein
MLNNEDYRMKDRISKQELMEMYQQQQKIRKELENLLRQNGLTPDGKKILDQMKDAEKQLLNKGFKNEVLNKMLNIKHELLKLEKALQKQGEEEKRESESNKKSFAPNNNPLPVALQKYLNSIENLNRQNLPLHPKYQEKVKEYFNISIQK